MAAEEEIRGIIYAWRGHEMPMQFVVSARDVEVLAKDAKRGL